MVVLSKCHSKADVTFQTILRFLKLQILIRLGDFKSKAMKLHKSIYLISLPCDVCLKLL